MNATSVPPKICPSCGVRYTADALFCPSDGTPLSNTSPFGDDRVSDAPDPYLGKEISGHIEIRQLAGVGAMGRVYRAFQRGIDRDVAVKILHRELSANPQLVARFHREAKVASRLQHPNVVQVHLAGQLPDGALYIVMEYLDGMSLQSALAAAGGHVPLPRALHFALQICDAAGEAHSKGVVHRDLKPENVMVIRRGEDPDFIKVLDFGIARLNWGEQSMATAAGLIFGTARYISPEGAQGDTVGPTGDVYAIATLLYQMLAGRTPFEGEQAVALLVQQIHDAPPRLQSIPQAAGVPDPIASVIMRNLAKSAAERAPDARVLGRMLVEAAKACGLSPDDLVPRSMLLGSKQSAMQLPPIQRTKQLELTPDIAARMSGPPHTAAPETLEQAATGPKAHEESSGAATARRASVPTVASAATASMSAAPPAVSEAPPPRPTTATAKWTPSPPGVTPDVKPVAPYLATAENGLPPARKPFESNVDQTMDDDDSPQNPRTEGVPPTLRDSLREAGSRATGGFPSPPQAEADFLSAPQAGADFLSPPQAGAPRPVARTEFGEPAFVAAKSGGEWVRAASPSAPGLYARPSADAPPTTGDSAEPEGSPRRARSRAAVVVFLCFLVGVIAAAMILVKLGLLGGAQLNAHDAQVARADEAMRHKRWDTPAGDNVRDLTDDGLARWPKDPRLLDIRERAADELVKEAVGRKFGGDLAAALHLAQVANELDPSDTTAQHLVQDYQVADKPQATDKTPATSTDASVAPVRVPTSKPAPIATPTAKVTLDATPLRPRVGQLVALLAKVTNAAGGTPKSLEEVHFRLNGPGLAPDTRLTAVPDVPGTYRAAFTFFEAGKYDIIFEARADGVLLRSVRQIAAGEDAPPGSATTTPPPPAPSGKWL